MFNNEYTLHKNTLVEAINHIDDFLTKMNKFNEKNNNYKSITTITKSDMGWDVKILITSEQKDIKTSKETISTSRVL